jgi:hypothetical protein
LRELFFSGSVHAVKQNSVLDHSSQIWWRWMNIFFTLVIWSVELLVSSEDDAITKEWKVD